MDEGVRLHPRLLEVTAASIGSGERLQIAALLAEARRVAVSDGAAKAVRAAVVADPFGLESNLDLLPPLSNPVWVEWPLATTTGHGRESASPASGCLLAPHPHDPDCVAVVTGWVEGTAVGHSYGVAQFSLSELAARAAFARARLSREPSESLERVMSSIAASIPEGLSDELAIMRDGTADMDAVLRDATGEVPLALGLILATVAEGGLLLDERDGWVEADLAPVAAKRIAERAGEALGRPAGRGFVRRGPALAFRPL